MAILISRNETNVTRALTHAGVPANVAHRAASSFGSSAGGGGGARRLRGRMASVAEDERPEISADPGIYEVG